MIVLAQRFAVCTLVGVLLVAAVSAQAVSSGKAMNMFATQNQIATYFMIESIDKFLSGNGAGGP